jgi:diaminopimelate decarboxylase
MTSEPETLKSKFQVRKVLTNPVKPEFGHEPEVIDFWKRLVREALSLSTPTPLYLCSAMPIAQRIAEMDQALAYAGFDTGRTRRPAKICCRHWLSCKTQPLAPLLRWWRGQGRPIEVVSEFEMRAALAEGFAPPEILINGPAKHHWLARHELRGLAVNFDSPAELAALLPLAKKLDWRCGVRLNTSEEYDPENALFPTQFGFTADEAVTALKKLTRSKARLEAVSFHLRSNLPSAQVYQRALAEVAEICRTARFTPQILDLGGGLPARHVLTPGGKVLDGEFSLGAFAEMLRVSAKQFPGLREIWLENGRFVSSCSGVLVVTVLDAKARRGQRQLICDGGRTLHALTSLWEQHRILSLPERSGAEMPTSVYGPTCMAFDRLARIPLPRSLRPGDHLVWLEAGAYHIPWESRFSYGHAAVLWHDESGLRLARHRQSFEQFWGQWVG